ncbi:hypothetical protein EON80_07555, partial [bacterium]
MTAVFGIGAAILMMSSTSLLSWNARREAENTARSSLNEASLALRQPLRNGADLEKIKEVLGQHNGRIAQRGWANEVEAWLISKGGAVKWKTGPFLPPRSAGGEDDGGL